MSNIRVPVMPKPARIEAVQFCDDGLFFTAEQLTARDAKWQEMVGPLLEIAERAKRLVEHADFKLGGILSANSKASEIPSNAASSVKARHLASLRDSLAALSAITKD